MDSESCARRGAFVCRSPAGHAERESEAAKARAPRDLAHVSAVVAVIVITVDVLFPDKLLLGEAIGRRQY